MMYLLRVYHFRLVDSTLPSNFSGTVIIVVAIFAISFSVIAVFKMLRSGCPFHEI